MELEMSPTWTIHTKTFLGHYPGSDSKETPYSNRTLTGFTRQDAGGFFDPCWIGDLDGKRIMFPDGAVDSAHLDTMDESPEIRIDEKMTEEDPTLYGPDDQDEAGHLAWVDDMNKAGGEEPMNAQDARDIMMVALKVQAAAEEKRTESEKHFKRIAEYEARKERKATIKRIAQREITKITRDIRACAEVGKSKVAVQITEFTITDDREKFEYLNDVNQFIFTYFANQGYAVSLEWEVRSRRPSLIKVPDELRSRMVNCMQFEWGA
jgi:hypothetical protein